MKDDYLWDKSGQPDPQIQQLEEILGTLRYEPRPLVMPDNLRSPRRRNHFPLLAIAAAILLAMLAVFLLIVFFVVRGVIRLARRSRRTNEVANPPAGSPPQAP